MPQYRAHYHHQKEPMMKTMNHAQAFEYLKAADIETIHDFGHTAVQSGVREDGTRFVIFSDGEMFAVSESA